MEKDCNLTNTPPYIPIAKARGITAGKDKSDIAEQEKLLSGFKKAIDEDRPSYRKLYKGDKIMNEKNEQLRVRINPILAIFLSIILEAVSAVMIYITPKIANNSYNNSIPLANTILQWTFYVVTAAFLTYVQIVILRLIIEDILNKKIS